MGFVRISHEVNVGRRELIIVKCRNAIACGGGFVVAVQLRFNSVLLCIVAVEIVVPILESGILCHKAQLNIVNGTATMLGDDEFRDTSNVVVLAILG